MNNKIIAVVKFNDHEAFVMQNKINLTYSKINSYTIVGINNSGLVDCFYLEHPTSKRLIAFAGREFDIKLDDGSVEHCHGQWWSGINSEAKEFLRDKIINVTANDVDDLKRCYVYTGYHGIENKIKLLRAAYHGPVYGYYEYEKILKSVI